MLPSVVQYRHKMQRYTNKPSYGTVAVVFALARDACEQYKHIDTTSGPKRNWAVLEVCTNSPSAALVQDIGARKW